MTGSGLRVVVAGATGSLGAEVLAVLAERRFPATELVPFATEASLGEDIEFMDQVLPVKSGAPPLRGADLVFLCTPPEAALELAAEALRQRAPTIDLSGALAMREEVPLGVAGVHQPAELLAAPLVALPPGPAVAWLRVLAPLHAAFGLERIVATSLESSAVGGRRGIEALSAETIALFNQQDSPEPDVFGQPVAFDCVTQLGEPGPGGATAPEAGCVESVRRILGDGVEMALTTVQVPTFCGVGTTLALESRTPIAPAEAADLLRKTDGVEVGGFAPTTRATAGLDSVGVGRIRPDPSRAGGLLLWLVADPLRVAAANAVGLAEARLRTH